MSPEVEFLNGPPQRCNRCHCVSVLFHPDPDLGTPAAPADRRVAVLAATGTSFLVILISFLAIRAGWWAGGFLDIPRAVLIAVYLPFSITGYALWLGAYRWLARRTRHAIWIYTLVVLVFIPVVTLVDPIQMQRGHFTLGGYRSGLTRWSGKS